MGKEATCRQLIRPGAYGGFFYIPHLFPRTSTSQARPLKWKGKDIWNPKHLTPASSETLMLLHLRLSPPTGVDAVDISLTQCRISSATVCGMSMWSHCEWKQSSKVGFEN